MTRKEIISSLEDQAQDKMDFIGDVDNPNDIFAHDVRALLEAAELLREQSGQKAARKTKGVNHNG